MNDQFRAEAAMTYRNHLIATIGYPCPNVQSAEELIAIALKSANPPFEAERGWRTEPPFPGLGEPPQEMPNGKWRMICAAPLYVNDLKAGVIFTTIYSGKPSAVVLDVSGSEIPGTYRRLT